MAINITEIHRKKIISDTIEALELVLASIKNCDEISSASFCSEPEYDETIKNSGVWIQKYTNGWQNLSIALRYRVDNSGACYGQKEA